jgi:hypothetical protein
MKTVCNYPGVHGAPWTASEKRRWLWSRRKHPDREYDMDVTRYFPKEEGFHAVSYGVLTAPIFCTEERGMGNRDYLIFAIVPDTFYPPGGSINGNVLVEHFPPNRHPTNIERQESINKPTILITGGVHGYEISGIRGAQQFLSSGLANIYSKHFNIVIVPCVLHGGMK